jgi:hypothetical protein
MAPLGCSEDIQALLVQLMAGFASVSATHALDDFAGG